MTQDFKHRVSIVVDKSLPAWQVLNTAAHIAAYFGNRMGEQFGTGESFRTKGNVQYPRNSQYPIIILSASSEQMPVLANAVRKAKDIQGMYFIREMIETTNDDEIVQRLAAKSSNDVEILGVGIFGENQRVKDLTKGFRLWGT